MKVREALSLLSPVKKAMFCIERERESFVCMLQGGSFHEERFDFICGWQWGFFFLVQICLEVVVRRRRPVLQELARHLQTKPMSQKPHQSWWLQWCLLKRKEEVSKWAAATTGAHLTPSCMMISTNKKQQHCLKNKFCTLRLAETKSSCILFVQSVRKHQAVESTDCD